MQISSIIIQIIMVIWNIVTPIFHNFNYWYWPQKTEILEVKKDIVNKQVLNHYNQLANYYNSFIDLNQVNSTNYGYLKKFIIFSLKQ